MTLVKNVVKKVKQIPVEHFLLSYTVFCTSFTITLIVGRLI